MLFIGVELLELVVIALIILVGVTQVVFPIIRGTNLFPLFRSRARTLDRELREAHEAEKEARITAAIQRAKARAAEQPWAKNDKGGT